MFGDQYVITAFGREWLQSANNRPVIDSSRLAQLLNTFSGRFGDGYAQWASEAVRTYGTANSLAASVMASAAAESILIALAVAKSGDEKKVLSTYNGPSGRARTTKFAARRRPSLATAALGKRPLGPPILERQRVARRGDLDHGDRGAR